MLLNLRALASSNTTEVEMSKASALQFASHRVNRHNTMGMTTTMGTADETYTTAAPEVGIDYADEESRIPAPKDPKYSVRWDS